jgi:branched-chain amino acid transport system ATP-binding protein
MGASMIQELPGLPEGETGRQPPEGSEPAAALELMGIAKRFGRTEVLRDATLTVRRGERLAVIGPNGAGKTSLFDIVSGRLAPSAGQVRLDGQRIDGLPPHAVQRRGLGRSHQVSQLFARLTVAEHLRCALLPASGKAGSFWRRLATMRSLQREVHLWLERLGLLARADVPAAALSYAEQRALEIGLAAAGGSPVLLLDEPTAGMSRSETQRCVALIRSVCEGRTLLVVEHDMAVVFELADRIAVLADGRFIAVDTPERVRADARVQQAYLGTAMQHA